MINAAELIEAGFPVSVNDEMGVLMANAALEWLKENTTLEFSLADPETIKTLPATAKLFVDKYAEVMRLKPGVSSQSIEGLSISFNSTDKGAMLWQLASTLLGSYLRQVRFTPATRRW
jgi:hypothetical protein